MRTRSGITVLGRHVYLWLRSLRVEDEDVYAPHGIPIWVPREVDVQVRYALARSGRYELPEARMVANYVGRGIHVVELGGCLGVVSASIRAAIGPDAFHVVVEAMPALAEICRVNARIGAAPDSVRVISAAIDYSGARAIRFHRGDNAHVGRVARDGEDAILVPTTTLGTVAAQLPTGPFAVVCDIEGGEIDLVARDGDLIARSEVFILETHPRFYPNGERDRDELVARIKGLGLRLDAREQDVFCFVRGGAAGRRAAEGNGSAGLTPCSSGSGRAA